ncbi:short-chain dehydrogenase [Sphingobacteriales bacterium UPWRP_1]|nr:short-chain dehydrogenase [Sphingobacteriales bacterium TSM_CSS]PSJ78404.1 short-chain dehydrogenase [Sphingobacteriales bacterium UPWRP_1]
MNIDLTGKNALVCGSSQGIGKAAAEELALLGANITLFARTESSLREVLQGLDQSKGQHHNYLCADFSNPEQVQQIVAGYLALQQTVFHILVNNTGGPPGGPITNATPQAFLQAYNNHLICNQLLAQTVLPGMKAAQYGRIINIISTSVKAPIAGLGVSNTTRWAVAGWAKTWANEVGQFGITVNNVLPGYTATQRLYSLIDARAAAAQTTPQAIAADMVNSIPARRFAQPHEVAVAVAFLASPAAAYINGINLPVDGGRTDTL